MNTSTHRPRQLPEGESVPTRAALISSALALVEEEGHELLTVRGLARRTFYSPSAVGYWVSPLPEFKSDVWHAAMTLLVTECVEPFVGTEDGFDHTAQALLSWSDRHPKLAEFCVSYRADPARHPDALGLSDPLGLTGLELSGEVVSNLSSFARHVQVAIERAIECPERRPAIGMLASDLEIEVERARQRFADSRARQAAGFSGSDAALS